MAQFGSLADDEEKGPVVSPDRIDPWSLGGILAALPRTRLGQILGGALGSFAVPGQEGAGGAAFGTLMPSEEAERPRGVLDRAVGLVGHAVKDATTLPQRAGESAQRYMLTGEYDPGPILEAATLPMGGTSLSAPRGAMGAGPVLRRASAADINKAAAESLKGVTQPELRQIYTDLGLTGGAPSSVVQGSVTARQPASLVREATDLKMQDRAFLDTLTAAQRRDYLEKGDLPGDALLPSQEAQRGALQAFQPVKKEITKAEKAFDTDVERGIKRSIFDLSPKTLNKTPNVDQFSLPRVAPEITERLASVPRGGMARIERAAGAAPKENWGWYNLMQARDVFHKIHGSKKGEGAFQAWLDGVAGTSMVNPIDNNLRSSTWYLQQVLQGKPLPEVLRLTDPRSGKTVQTMAGGPPPGYGAKAQIQHADRVREYMTNSYDPVANPKPISFRTNLSGNWMPRTVDTHDIRNMVGMPDALSLFGENAGLLPKEYSYLEGVGQRAASRARAPQAGQQAATWIGGGDYTGLKSYPAPLLEALNRRAHVTGSVRGQSAMDALIAAFSGREPLF